MKKYMILSAILLVAFVQAQNGFGVKAGYTYNADDGLFKTVDQTYQTKGNGADGYHIGIYKKINLSGMYIMPELWYVNYKNEFESELNNIDVKYKRIDIPVSLGTQIFKIAQVQGGLVMSYYFDDEINLNNIDDIKQDELALAFQLGAGISLDNLGFGIRYDFPFEERQTEWIQENDYNFITENTPKLLHVSVSYSF